MTVRNETETLAQAICDKWAQKIGWGRVMTRPRPRRRARLFEPAS